MRPSRRNVATPEALVTALTVLAAQFTNTPACGWLLDSLISVPGQPAALITMTLLGTGLLAASRMVNVANPAGAARGRAGSLVTRTTALGREEFAAFGTPADAALTAMRPS